MEEILNDLFPDFLNDSGQELQVFIKLLSGEIPTETRKKFLEKIIGFKAKSEAADVLGRARTWSYEDCDWSWNGESDSVAG